jgi:RHS repeat-associated protein
MNIQIRKIVNKRHITTLEIALFLVFLSAISTAQPVSNSDFKIDKNLRSTARVNPATLGMEFSLPLGSYTGRAGNSIPIAFNYSSKVWNMRRWQYWHNELGGWGTQVSPYLITNVTEYMPYFAEHSIVGWTSSFKGLEVLPDEESYYLDGAPVNGFSNNLNETWECSLESAISQYDAACIGGWSMHEVWSCDEVAQLADHTLEFDYCVIGPVSGGGGGTGGGGGLEREPRHPPDLTYPDFRVNQIRVVLPDGTSSTFRKDDKVYDCNNVEQCAAVYSHLGSFLSVDGSGKRLITQAVSSNHYVSTLYNADGSRWVIDSLSNTQEYFDKNGNRSTLNVNDGKSLDTKGNLITDPLKFESFSVGTHPFQLPGLDGQAPLNFSQTWSNLKPAGCTTGSEPACADSALENPSDILYSVGTDICGNRHQDQPSTLSSLFEVDPPQNVGPLPNDQNIWYDVTNKQRICGAEPFNPVLLTEVAFPDGSKYKFRYNRYGEISKIIFPTGSYERFRYDTVGSLTYLGYPIQQTNRGVVERWISEDGQNVSQHWAYSFSGSVVTQTNPDNSRTETKYLIGSAPFGLENPLNGQVVDSKSFDENNILRRRTLNDYAVTPARTGGHEAATRNARATKSVSIMFENGKALATLTENEYDVNGSTDPEFFSELNVKRKKTYNYVSVDPAAAANNFLTWETISSWFASATPASVTETDYVYNSDYKNRGILGLPIRIRFLNPLTLDPNNPLSLTEIIYDNAIPTSNANYPYSIQSYGTGNSMDCSSDPQTPKICWQNPNGASENIDLSYRGLPTTTRTWYAEQNTWIESHTQYDQFGNVVKVKDPLGNEASTVYGGQYKYAYPTSTTAPAPDPTNTHGTNATTTTLTSYDFNTGLPLSVTDDSGQMTTTEYDASLRPFRVNPVVVNGSPTGPKTETIYGTPDGNGHLPPQERFVKVRKQLDANNWDEATTWFDGLGRTIKTQAKDSQGDVFVVTHYDDFGRVDRVTNPHRAGDTVYWSKTRYDAAGRAVETYAPTELPNLANAQSLGITSFDLCSTLDTTDPCTSNFVGIVVITTDASGRKSRSITNALGQLIRVDEPTGIGSSETTDLGSLASPLQATIYTYSPEGKMVRVKQGDQNRYFKYDSLGRLLRVNQPEQEYNQGLYLPDSYNSSGNWTAGFVYDISGNVIRATDANGVNIINEYDSANRVIRRCYTKPDISLASNIDTCAEIATGDRSIDTPTVEFWYDGKGLDSQPSPNFARGKLTKVDNGISSTEYMTFDNFGRLTRTRQITDGIVYGDDAHPMTYSYNLSGALVQETYPSGRVVKNEFESDGDLSAVKGVKAGGGSLLRYASNFSYTSAGGVLQMQLGNLLWETAKFNERLQVYELGLGAGPTNTSLWKTNYEYGELDGSGNVITSKNTGNIARQTLTVPGASFVQNYRYDSLYRLTEAVEKTGTTQNWIQNWNYDRYGNRNSFTQNIAGNTNATNPAIDPNTNRFTSTDFGYDHNGNVTRDVDPLTSLSRTFVFNGDNKQTEVKDANGATIGRYFYDGEGKRVKKVVGSETTVFVYSSGKLIAEYSTQTEPNPVVHYTTTDHLGSPRIITDQYGQVTSRRDFMPFGEEIDPSVGNRSNAGLQYSAGDSVRQKFTGYQKDDETSLDFAEARMYENRYGRFTAVDPKLASGKSSNPQTFNRYVYVMSCPLRLFDPTGLDWWDVINNSTGKREIAWFDEDPDEDEYTIRERWTQYVYLASDKKWYALNPNAGEFDFFYDANAAKLKYGLYTDFNGDFDGFAYAMFGVKDMAHLVANMRTGNLNGALGDFAYISGTNGVAGGLSKYLLPVDDAALFGIREADNLLGNSADNAVPKGWAALGKWGEDKLAKTLGGAAKNTKPIQTTLGNRIPDFLVDGISYEAKAGVNVGLTSSIRKQVLKDAELILTKRINGAEWHFYQGAQKELLDFLSQNGIRSVVH